MLRILLAPSARSLVIAAGLLLAAPMAASAGDAASGGHGRTQQTAGESSREQAGNGRAAAQPVLLARGSGFGRLNGSPRVRGVQRRLNRLGFPAGPVDGLYGPRTEAAVVTFQRARGLVADGIVGRRTVARLRRSGVVLARGAGFERRSGSSAVRRLQRRLKRVGQRPGPVDGLFGPRTEAAVLAFQAAVRLERDGIVGPRTRTSLRQRIRQLARQRVSAPERDRPAAPGTSTASEPPATSTATEPSATPSATEPPATPTPSEPPAPSTAIEPIATRTPSQPLATPTAGEPPATPSAGATATTTDGGDDGGLKTGWLVAVTIVAFGIGLALARPDLPRRRRPEVDARSAEDSPVGAERHVPAPSREKEDALAPTGEEEEAPTPTVDSETPLAPMSEKQEAGAPVGDEAGSRPPRVVTIDLRPEGPPDTGSEDQRGPAVTASSGGPAPDAALRATGYASIPALGPRSEFAEQERQIRAACERHGLELVRMTHDVERVTRGYDPRPGLEQAFQTIADGEASVLVVAELTRLSRSAVDLGDIVAQFEHTVARLIVIDPELDTATPEGRLAARALRTAGQLEERHARERGRPAPTGTRRTAPAPAAGRRVTDRSRLPTRRNGPEAGER